MPDDPLHPLPAWAAAALRARPPAVIDAPELAAAVAGMRYAAAAAELAARGFRVYTRDLAGRVLPVGGCVLTLDGDGRAINVRVLRPMTDVERWLTAKARKVPVYVLRRFMSNCRPVAIDDAVAAGTAAVIRAAYAYDQDRGVKFLTVAVTYARSAMSAAARAYVRGPVTFWAAGFDPAARPAASAAPVTAADLRAYVPDLSDRDAAIVVARFGLDGENPRSPSETGAAAGVTRATVAAVCRRFVHAARVAVFDSTV